jgi:hypothetical protein
MCYDLFLRILKTCRYFLWWDTTLFKFLVNIKDAYRLREPIQDLEVSFAGPQDYIELLRFSSHLTARQMRERSALGHKCVLIRKKETIIFQGWIGLNKIRLRFRGKSLMLPADTAYFYDIRTDRNHQGGKVFLTFTSYAREHCLRRDVRFAFTLVDPKIGLPIRAYTKLVGAHTIYLVRFRRRLGIGLYSEKEISKQEARRLSQELRST